jgi:hypothetical protein
LELLAMASAPPEDFRCPISLELMSDPVILATGQTYDRSSIQRWLDAGHRTCPKTKQLLYEDNIKLIPNYALRSLVHQWASVHGIDLNKKSSTETRSCSSSSSSSSSNSSSTSNSSTSSIASSPHRAACYFVPESDRGLRARIEGLVKSLSHAGAGQTQQLQIDAVKKLILIAKECKENRSCIVEAGGIPAILSLVSSREPRVEEAGLQCLLELSLDDENKVGLVAEGCVDVLIEALKASTMEARMKAAAMLTSLSLVDVNKATIGGQPGVISGLVKLLAEGNLRAKKESMNALSALCMFHDNKPKAVSSGVVPLLLALLMEGRGELVEHALTVLDFLSTCAEGRLAIIREPALPTLVGLLRSGSARSKEHSAAVLWSLCTNSKKYTLQAFNAGALDTCLSLMQAGTTTRAKRKASLLVKAFQECGQWPKK